MGNFWKFYDLLRVYKLYSWENSQIDSVQDVLIMLGIKACLHILKLSIFSLNHDIVRPTKILNNLLYFHRHFSASKINRIILNFWKLWFLKYLVFSKCAQFLSSLFIILVGLTMTLFSEKMLISLFCIHCLMPNLIKKSWTVSIPKLLLIIGEIFLRLQRILKIVVGKLR